MRIYLKHWCWF